MSRSCEQILAVTLNCCGSTHHIHINERGIRNLEPNEVKKNILCSTCERLVILSLTLGDAGATVKAQEIVD